MEPERGCLRFDCLGCRSAREGEKKRAVAAKFKEQEPGEESSLYEAIGEWEFGWVTKVGIPHPFENCNARSGDESRDEMES